jgi:hypothetical protein
MKPECVDDATALVEELQMKPECVDDATALVEELLPEITALPGLLQFIDVCNEDGSGYVVSITDSQESSDANMDHVRQIWARFSDYLEEMPTPEGYTVLFNERIG